MGSEEESSRAQLTWFSSVPLMELQEPSGMKTPPLQTTRASVPFQWEEEPGKARPCTALIALPIPSNKCLQLQLPPRLHHHHHQQQQQQMDCCYTITISPSPTSHQLPLRGPYSIDDDDDDGVNMANHKRNEGFLTISQARSNFWATIFKRFKQLTPWKHRISKKQAHAFTN